MAKAYSLNEFVASFLSHDGIKIMFLSCLLISEHKDLKYTLLRICTYIHTPYTHIYYIHVFVRTLFNSLCNSFVLDSRQLTREFHIVKNGWIAETTAKVLIESINLFFIVVKLLCGCEFFLLVFRNQIISVSL